MSLVFERSEEIAQLVESLARLLRAEQGFEARRQRMYAQPPQRLALWPALAELGVLHVLAPSKLGGFGDAPADVAAVFEAAASALLLEPLAMTLIGLRALAGRGPANATLAEQVLSGAAVAALAHAERLDVFGPPSTRASAIDSGFVITGAKPAVRHGDIATDFLVSAALEPGRVGLFRIRRDTPGLVITPTRAIDGAGAGDLVLDGVRAAGVDLLDSDAMPIVQDALEWGLMALCVESAAICATVNRETFAYLKVREQFGQALAQFQALQHRAADMAIAEQEAAGMAVEAIAAMATAASSERHRTLLTASLACDRAARSVTHGAVQLFGGMGVSDELSISHYARRAAANRTWLGGLDARAGRLSELERVSL